MVNRVVHTNKLHRDSNPGIPNPGISDALTRDFGIICPNFNDICPKKYFSPNFGQIWGQFQAVKLHESRPKRTRPQHQLTLSWWTVDIVLRPGAIVLNKLFMRLRALLTALARA